MGQTTKNSRDIKAKIKTIYQALTNPATLEVWQAPGDMTAKIRNFYFRVGGGYQMSLLHPGNEKVMKGNSSGKEDRYTARRK